MQQLRAVAGPVSRETFQDLERFEDRFRKWSGSINLAAQADLAHLWERHILDSAQLAALKRDARLWLDLGSGGGFPGAILAILVKDRPGGQVHLVESNRKKAAFLTSVLGELGAPATVHARRIEDVRGVAPDCEIVTARALAPLPALLGLASAWLQNGATALFQKGRDYRAELAESRVAWNFDLVKHESKTDAEGVILEISRLQPQKAVTATDSHAKKRQ